MGNFDDARAEVQHAFDAAMACADTSEKQSFFEFERNLWALLLALGRALVTLFLARQAMRPREVEYRRGKRSFVLAGDERTSDLGTRFGKVRFRRPVARPIGGPKAKMDLPIDRELGLCGGFSLGTVTAIARLAAMMAFVQARQTFAEFHEGRPAPELYCESSTVSALKRSRSWSKLRRRPMTEISSLSGWTVEARRWSPSLNMTVANNLTHRAEERNGLIAEHASVPILGPEGRRATRARMRRSPYWA